MKIADHLSCPLLPRKTAVLRGDRQVVEHDADYRRRVIAYRRVTAKSIAEVEGYLNDSDKPESLRAMYRKTIADFQTKLESLDAWLKSVGWEK